VRKAGFKTASTNRGKGAVAPQVTRHILADRAAFSLSSVCFVEVSIAEQVHSIKKKKKRDDVEWKLHVA